MDDCTIESLCYVDGVEKNRNARNMIIDILQILDMPLWAKLYIAYLYVCKIEKNGADDKKLETIYKLKDYLKEIYKGLDNIKISFSDKLEYIKTFLKIFLGEAGGFYKLILDFADELNMDAFMEYYVFLEEFMADYDLFFQNYSVNMIFSNCVKKAGESNDTLIEKM